MPSLSQTISRYRARLVRGSFGHNVLVMFTGTAIGQLGSVLLSPLLTRIYTPAMFGILGLFTAILFVGSIVSTLRYELALPLARSEDEAANLLAVCMAALALTTALFAAAVALLPDCGDCMLSLDALAPYEWLLPIGFFCLGAYHTLIYYATRRNEFAVIARTKIYQGGLGPLSQIVFGLAGAGPWGLITGFIIGQCTGIGLLFRRLVMAPRALRRVTLAGMKTMASRFRRFPLLSSWSALIETAGDSTLLLIAVPLLYSHTVAGFVFLTDRVIARPLLMISTSILQVYIGDVSQRLESDPAAVRARFLQLAGKQLIVVGFWLALVNGLASFAFPLAFGEEWAAAVPYLHVLSIAYLPQMVIHALTHTLQILEKQILSAIWVTGRLISVLAVFAAGYILGFDALEALMAYSAVQAAAQLVLFLLMYRSIQSLQKDASHG